MRPGLMLCFLLFLAGCNTPPPAFGGIAPVRVQVEQSLFDVRIRGDRAHALRLNPEYTTSLAAVAPRARRAIEQASGCRVAEGSIAGDAIFVTAGLRC